MSGKVSIMKKCKCCEADIERYLILRYPNMPARAQNFPGKDDLEKEKGTDLEIYQCPYCGLLQLFSEPVDYYKDVIRAVAVSDDMRQFREDYFHKFVEKYTLYGKKFVEIGAGCGEYMDLFSAENIELYGLEHLEESVKTANSKGLKVYSGFIENQKTKIPGMPYDVFYIMNFLEHIPNPKEFLKGIANNLSEDGYGLIEVPNGDFIIQNQLYSEFMLDHLMYFTQDSLMVLLNQCGFEVLESEVIWNDYIISTIVRKKKMLNSHLFIEKQNETMTALNNYLDRLNKLNKKIAIWGAGHQALALMALSSMNGKVLCVIDSAKFKQNKFTPVTHIPILSPDMITELGIEEVIIMAGSYSNEILKIIRSRFPLVHAVSLDMLI